MYFSCERVQSIPLRSLYQQQSTKITTSEDHVLASNKMQLISNYQGFTSH
jgi:hypothetical protein